MDTKYITKLKKARLHRDEQLYKEYHELIKQKGAMKMVVTEHLMKKYGIYSQATIWQIRKRVERILKEQTNRGRQGRIIY